MIRSTKNNRLVILLSGLLVVVACVNISLGSVAIPVQEIFNSIVDTPSKSSWHYIITNYRFPKAITAIIAGSGLAISGLLMQTLFRKWKTTDPQRKDIVRRSSAKTINVV